MIDLTGKKTDISPKEEMEIAVTLQFLLMNELFSNAAWRAPNAVFHGGTALSMLYRNGRWSEDLDFMVDEKLLGTLDRTMVAAAERLQILARQVFDGCSIDLNGPKGGTVRSWYFGWTHPNRHGKVRVKVEFLPKPQDALRNYLTSKMIPLGPSGLPLTVTSVIHGPQLISSWSDKIVAMSQRPYFKWRDVYDMWFVDRRMRQLAASDDPAEHADYPSDQAFMDALETTASIYGNTVEEIGQGLDRLLDQGVLEDAAQYAKDIAKWLPQSIAENSDLLDLHRRSAKLEVERALGIIREHAPRGPSL